MIQKTIVFIVLLCSLYPTYKSFIVASPSDNQKVKLQIFYESLCPHCNRFISKQFSQLLLKEDIWQILDLKMLPYGNGKHSLVNGSFYFSCQHGEQQCRDNYKLYKQALPFIICFQNILSNVNVTAQKCAKQNKLNCQEGKKSMFQVGQKTKNSGTKGVPSILLNGVQNNRARNYLIKQICKSYTGPLKIKSCF